MDDLDFIKKHVPQKVEEGLTFRSSAEMLRHLLGDVVDVHMECEAEHGPEDEISLQLEDLVRRYRGAKVKTR